MSTCLSRIRHTAALAMVLLFTSLPALADITLPHILADGAILQREKPLTLWGWAAPGETIVVSVDGEVVVRGKADSDGNFLLTGPTYTAGGPHTITLQGSNTVELEDIWFGDVWLASGQSNMELPMSRVREKYADAIVSAGNPMIRQFKVQKEVAYDGPWQDHKTGNWEVATSQSVLNFSATAYFFAREIQPRIGVPVGVINSAFGGSPAQGWMSAESLKEDYPHYYEAAVKWSDTAYLEKVKAEDKAANDQWYAYVTENDKGSTADTPWQAPALDDSNWQTVAMPGNFPDQKSGVFWLRKTVDLPKKLAGKEAVLRVGRIVDADTVWVNGERVGGTGYQYPPRIYSVPEGVLKAGENVIAVRVVVNNSAGAFIKDKPYVLEVGGRDVSLEGEWRYAVGVEHTNHPGGQFSMYSSPVGMYNAMLAPLFNMKLKGIIWYQGESNISAAEEYATLFPALIRLWRDKFGEQLPFVFAQLPGYGEPADEPGHSQWAVMRQSQAAALAEPDTAMGVNIDLGEWNDIHPLNKKDVGERLALAATELVYDSSVQGTSPTVTSADRKGNRLVLQVQDTAGKLAARGKPGGFDIAGTDGEFVRAKVKIKGDRIVVWHPDVEQPVQVRYAWADFPHLANIYSKAGLPLTPFFLTLED